MHFDLNKLIFGDNYASFYDLMTLALLIMNVPWKEAVLKHCTWYRKLARGSQ
jgi:hypothetical protein